jgi:hypothetical protein
VALEAETCLPTLFISDLQASLQSESISDDHVNELGKKIQIA